MTQRQDENKQEEKEQEEGGERETEGRVDADENEKRDGDR